MDPSSGWGLGVDKADLSTDFCDCFTAVEVCGFKWWESRRVRRGPIGSIIRCDTSHPKRSLTSQSLSGDRRPRRSQMHSTRCLRHASASEMENGEVTGRGMEALHQSELRVCNAAVTLGKDAYVCGGKRVTEWVLTGIPCNLTSGKDAVADGAGI